ncbi:MAG: hypothetical protein AB8B80_04125 [Marinicellaceae bacterium]
MGIDKHSDSDYLLFQIEQLEKQLNQEKINNTDRNKELQTHLSYLNRDLETLFSSKTWQVGYGVMNFYRKIMNLFGKRHDGQYMNGDHFKNLIENCEFYTHRKTKIHPTLADVKSGKFPKSHYEPTQVKVILNDLWAAQREDKK